MLDLYKLQYIGYIPNFKFNFLGMVLCPFFGCNLLIVATSGTETLSIIESYAELSPQSFLMGYFPCKFIGGGQVICSREIIVSQNFCYERF